MWLNLILCLVLIRPLASVPFRPNSHHWSSEDLLLLREEAKDTRNGLLHWWHPSRVLQVAIRRRHRRDVWLPEPLRVRPSVRLFLCTSVLPYARPSAATIRLLYACQLLVYVSILLRDGSATSSCHRYSPTHASALPPVTLSTTSLSSAN